ncbi:MAG: dihydroneopterin aldolase [Paludibacteraceae bacterium]|nr:dihydroneopterin aldolase [Paludibacteraceae bacterium]
MTISLQDIECFAYHGVFAQEKTNGNHFRVSVSISLPLTVGAHTDQVEDTIDYGKIYDIVQTQMAIPANLLEHVAYRIRTNIEQTFPQVEKVTVSVSKQNPPVGGTMQWATVEV